LIWHDRHQKVLIAPGKKFSETEEDPMTDRHLTISTLREPRPSRYDRVSKPDRVVPFLRLRGQWLEELGFSCGEKVRVTAEPGRLVIEPVAAEGVGDA